MKLMAVSAIVVVVFCVIQGFLCKEGVSYKHQRVACNKFNKMFLYNVTCRIRHLNRTTQLLNWNAHFQPNVSLSNIRIQAKSYYKFRTVYRPSLINLSEFICDALNNGTYSHILNALKESYAKYTNLLEPCPISGQIYVKNMIINTDKFPQFVPIGEFRMDVQAFTYMNGKEEFILLHQDYVEVKPLGILQF